MFDRKNLIYKRVLRYFFNGLLIGVPLLVTAWMVIWIYGFLNDNFGIDQVPGSGILILLLLFIGIGYLGTSLIGRPLRKWINGLLERVPLIKTIYGAISDLLSAFVGSKKRFNKPVLVKINESSHLEKLGFVTDEDLSDLGIEDDNKVAVYMPHSYNFSGNLFIVPKSAITPIEKNAAEVMKYIVSGGVIDVKEEDEGKE